MTQRGPSSVWLRSSTGCAPLSLSLPGVPQWFLEVNSHP